jgi:hypothetical protein
MCRTPDEVPTQATDKAGTSSVNAGSNREKLLIPVSDDGAKVI